jgi:hypothetical protein
VQVPFDEPDVAPKAAQYAKPCPVLLLVRGVVYTSVVFCVAKKGLASASRMLCT